MLARWLERGLGSILAPDENFAAQQPPSEEGNTSFWQMVAPDPVYKEKIKEQSPATLVSTPAPVSNAAAPPPDAFLSPTFKTGNVRCVHCQKMTPVKQEEGFATPSVHFQAVGDTNDELNQYVLSATKGYTESMISPPPKVDGQNKVFRLCASGKPLQGKLIQKLEKTLTKDRSLLKVRSVKLGQLVPDGLTPLMAAAHAGNVGATKVILEIDDKGHLERDLQGRTALHIAAEEGNLEVAEALNERHKKDAIQPDALLDLAGRTPFGRALTSPNPKARKNQSQLEKILFSPEDISIFGSPPPRHTRQTIHRTLDMVYGEAEMPGYRVLNEDTICRADWHDEATGEFYCLLGVCDGHGDQRRVSEYVAREVARRIQIETKKLGQESDSADWQKIWTDTCLGVDSDLKATSLAGGSTAVMALVTKNQIIVANVGDSRCILVQVGPNRTLPEAPGTPPLVAEKEPQSTDDAVDETKAEQGTDEKVNAEASPVAGDVAEARYMEMHAFLERNCGFTVIPLSEDHKPNLERERARIEKAGMTVVAETFEDKGEEITIHKVKKNSTSLMAVSRSFGDFEYKTNNELGPDEQAIIAVPEVQVHSRDAKRDLFLVAACDGIWDVMTNFDVAKFIVDREAETANETGVAAGRLAAIGDDLLRECLAKGSRDNMSVAVAALDQTMDKFTVTGEIQGKALQFSSPEKAEK